MGRMYTYQHPQHGEVKVIAGWDRPLQGFHLTIKKMNPDVEEEQGDESHYLFSNLDPDTFPHLWPPSNKGMISFSGLVETLEHFEIPAPRGFLGDLQIDKRIMGNDDKIYDFKVPRHENPWILETREADWENEYGDLYAGRSTETRYPSEAAARKATAHLEKTTWCHIEFREW